MADSSIAITAGAGTNIDTRTTTTSGDNRQVIVIGAPATDADVAPVDATAGLKVNLGSDNDITGTVTANAGTDLNTSALATSANQLADGHNVTIDNISTNEVFVRGGGTAGSATDGEVVAVQGIASGTAMAVTESSPISGFATSAKQLADGHNVTIDNGAAGAAVNIQDGGNTITVDGAVTNTVLSVVGGGAEATAQRVTIANDSTGLVSVDDGGGALTVDWAGTAPPIGAGTEATALKVTLATDSTGLLSIDDNGGSLTVDNTSIDGPGAPTIDSVQQFAINLTTGANQVLVSSAPNKQIWVYAVTFTCSVAGTVSFQDEDDTAITGIMDFAANSGLGIGASGNFAMPLWKLATDKDLEVDVVSANIDGWITYALVSV